MSDINNFKKAADEILKDVKVSDDLKKKTLARCEEKRSGRGGLWIPAAVAAALMVAALTPSLQFWKNRLDNNIIMMEGLEDGKGDSKGYTSKGNVSKDPDGGVIYRAGTLDEARSYIGEGFKEPKYIPSGFKQSLVEVPADMKSMNKDVTLGFEGENRTFTIIMRRGSYSLDSFKGDKEVDINGAKAYLTTGKQMAGTEVVSPVYTQMRWQAYDLLYILEGQISEDEALKVARSMK